MRTVLAVLLVAFGCTCIGGIIYAGCHPQAAVPALEWQIPEVPEVQEERAPEDYHSNPTFWRDDDDGAPAC